MSVAALIAHPLATPQPAASGRTGSVKSLVVEVVTHDGRSGFGEAFSPASPQAAASIVETSLAPILLGADENDIGGLWEQMRRALVTPVGGSGAEAVSAIDIALWDLLGQRLGAPIHALLGGHGRLRVPAYASFIGWIADAEAIAVAEEAVAHGFRQIKVKIQPPLHDALERVTLIRRAVGADIDLVADPNGSFSFPEAVRLALRLKELGYLWLEEPLDPADIAGLARLRALGILPMAAGESEYGPRGAIGLVTAGAVDLLQPDCGRIGGITGFIRAAYAAASLGVPFAPHHAGGPVKAAAALHLAAALPQFKIMECSLLRTALHDDLTDAPVAHPCQLEGAGTLPVPTAPGLGITINRAALKRLRLN